MADLVFDKPVTGVGEADAVNAQFEQSVLVAGPFVAVGAKQLLSGLIDNPADPNQYLMSEALIDTDEFTRVRFYAAGDIAGDPSVAVPPASADPLEGALIIDSRFWSTAGQNPAAGAAISVRVLSPGTSGSIVLLNNTWDDVTDAAGYLSISIPVGAEILICMPSAGIQGLTTTGASLLFLADLI